MGIKVRPSINTVAPSDDRDESTWIERGKHDLPLSWMLSVIVHGFMVAILFFIASALFFAPQPPPEITPVYIGENSTEESGGGSESDSEIQESDTPITEEVVESTPIENIEVDSPEVSEADVAEFGETVAQEREKVERANQSKAARIESQLREKIAQRQAGAKGDGPGKSGGMGGDGASTGERMARWTITFETIADIESAGGEIAIIRTESYDGNLYPKPSSAPGLKKSFSADTESRMIWTVENKKPIESALGDFGISAVMLFPSSFEAELRRLEQHAAKEKFGREVAESEIKYTRFELGSGGRVVVLNCELR